MLSFTESRLKPLRIRSFKFDCAMAKSFYKLPEKEIREALSRLIQPYDHDALQFLLIDGEFHGVTVVRFRNGPYDLNDVVVDLPNAKERRGEIIKAIQDVNYGAMLKRFMGKEL